MQGTCPLLFDDAINERNVFVVGVSPGGQKGKPGVATVGAGAGAGKGRVLMPKPSALLGAPTLGVPVACVTPDSVIGSPQSTGEKNIQSSMFYRVATVQGEPDKFNLKILRIGFQTENLPAWKKL